MQLLLLLQLLLQQRGRGKPLLHKRLQVQQLCLLEPRLHAHRLPGLPGLPLPLAAEPLLQLLQEHRVGRLQLCVGKCLLRHHLALERVDRRLRPGLELARVSKQLLRQSRSRCTLRLHPLGLGRRLECLVLHKQHLLLLRRRLLLLGCMLLLRRMLLLLLRLLLLLGASKVARPAHRRRPVQPLHVVPPAVRLLQLAGGRRGHQRCSWAGRHAWSVERIGHGRLRRVLYLERLRHSLVLHLLLLQDTRLQLRVHSEPLPPVLRCGQCRGVRHNAVNQCEPRCRRQVLDLLHLDPLPQRRGD